MYPSFPTLISDNPSERFFKLTLTPTTPTTLLFFSIVLATVTTFSPVVALLYGEVITI